MSGTPEHDEFRRFVLKPVQGTFRFSWEELWAYRELLWFFIWRDLKVRYKQTLIGVSWAVLQPLLMMLAFTLFFGQVDGFQTEGQSYALFTFVAILPWQLFSHALLSTSISLVSNQDLLKKVFFPRILIPVSSLSVGLVNFAIAMAMLLVMLVFWGIPPRFPFVFSLLGLAVVVTASLGVGLLLSALNGQYRDVQLVLPFLSQIWLFASPVIYPTSVIPQHWQLAYAVNPMVGAIDIFRWSFLGNPEPRPAMLGVSVLSAIFILAVGLVYFLRTQENIADVI